jgi:hypothetical protein
MRVSLEFPKSFMFTCSSLTGLQPSFQKGQVLQHFCKRSAALYILKDQAVMVRLHKPEHYKQRIPSEDPPSVELV